MFFSLKSLFFLAALFALNFQAQAQTEREKLEQRRIELREEIEKLNDLRNFNLKKEKSVLTEVQELNQQIKATQNLIEVNNRQANLLNKEIGENINKIERLEHELKVLKDDYASMIKKSYRSKSKQSRIMFLLSSENFLQAYKRLQYMKQYAKHRKKQGEEIKARTQQLEVLNQNLSERKKIKENIIAENRKIKSKLEEDKQRQQSLIKDIRKKEGHFVVQLKKKQQEINKIDQEIDRLIKEAIARSNEESGSGERDVFELTPEAKALAADFVSNKGKLPWPVRKGVVTTRFGAQPHPIIRSVTINSNGVRIATEKDAVARAIFDGVVSEVQVVKGANKAVMVRHGDFLTIYNNLSDIYVSRGDRVIRGQDLGTVAESTSTGKTVLYFLIYKNMQKLNPEEWIYKM